MTFRAANNRIQIFRADGKTIFDTAEPMPHIVLEPINTTQFMKFPPVDAGYIDYSRDNILVERRVLATLPETVYPDFLLVNCKASFQQAPASLAILIPRDEFFIVNGSALVSQRTIPLESNTFNDNRFLAYDTRVFHVYPEANRVMLDIETMWWLARDTENYPDTMGQYRNRPQIFGNFEFRIRVGKFTPPS